MRRILLLPLLMLVSMAAGAQVDFKISQKQVSADVLEIVFTGTIGDGWHIYSPSESNGPVPTTFNVDSRKGCEPIGALTSHTAPISHYEEMFDANVSYFEKQCVLSQKIRITGSEYSISGYLEYAACNDRSCMAPTAVEFSFSGKGPASAGTEEKAEEAEAPAEEQVQDSIAPDSAKAELPAMEDMWTPVTKELESFGETSAMGDAGLLGIFLLGLAGGLVALFTPCVWPIIPMTVSFFLKRSKNDRRKGVRDAFTYGLSIIVIYLALGLAVTGIFGASALNALSTNAVFNIFFFLMLLVFAASFLGGFEITLPSKWSNAVDDKASSTTGLLSIFLMAFTLVLVSFSCTGPIIGFLLVEMATSSILGPAIGMAGFAIALALPFTLFAMFPAWLKSMPKSGNWMNVIKVLLGFLELAFSLKFLSVADLAYGWHIMDREVFLSLWIMIFFLMGAYLIGIYRLPHDEDEYDDEGNVVANPRVGVIRLLLALASFAFAIYMVPGLWGAPCKAVSAFAPPMSTQDFKLGQKEIRAEYFDYEEGMEAARRLGKPVMIDFTGYGCVNCRKMEAAVWTDDRVRNMMMDDYVLIQLFVDDKTPLDKVMEVEENGQKRKLRTVGDKWSYFQRTKFGFNAQPFYVLLGHDGKPLNRSFVYDEDVDAYLDFLRTGLKNFKR